VCRVGFGADYDYEHEHEHDITTCSKVIVTDMKIIERQGLWLVLALALLLRLSPILFEHQVGQDIAEYKNIAENLRAGRGFVSDIKAYYAAPVRPADVTARIGGFALGPVEHYAFTDRPLLLPALLAILRLALPPLAAGQVVGPLLYLLALALIYQTVRREVGPAAAFSAGLLLALNPALFDLSLKPLSENTVLFSLALITWAHFRMRSPLLTGIACSVAFLARPSMLMFSAILGLIYLVESVRQRQPMRVLQFAFCAAVGPVWVMALNRAMGMPPTTLPQSFLFKVRYFTDGMDTFHTGTLYGGALGTIHAHGREIARRVVLNGLYYAQALATSEYLGMLVALAPIAVAGLAQATARPLRRFRLLALFAVLDLGLYVATWSTFDATRFLGVTLFVAILLLALGSHEIFDREPLFRRFGAWSSAAAWAGLAVSLVWLAMDGGKAWLALREWQTDKPLSNNL
jgi:hypothetical protein